MGFPTALWNGDTPNRDRSLAQVKSPNGEDWNVLTAEVIAIETKVGLGAGSFGTLVGASGKILVGDGNSFEEVAVSGQATLAASGAVTIPLLAATAGSVLASRAVIVDANITVRFGDWVGGGATNGGVMFTTALDKYSDGQLDVFSAFGASDADLGSGYSAKCGRFRHVVNCTTCAHESYGLAGQVIVRDTTLTHLHSGILGTFEGHTSGVIVDGSYTYGAAAIIARVGGGASITATKDVAGFNAFWNGAALAGGESVALAIGDAGGAGLWTHGIGVERCTNLLDLPAEATDPVISSGGAIGTHGTKTVAIRILVNNVAYYLLASTVPTYA